ncbi:MAG: flagellar basal-body MS-ring/collar protein FliF [Dehalococcoidia bacterium]
MGSAQQISAQLRRLWARLGRTQRMALIGVAGGAAVFAILFLNVRATPTYVTAFTNLDPKDSNAAVEQLKAENIPHQVAADGTTIKVAPDRLADARMKLAAKGLPKDGAVGFELFDKTSFGVTDFVQHLNYQRALEGELSRTITSLANVESARVHIVVPKQELFVSQQKPATASVLLKLRGARSLDENALRGIAHLVSRSVEGLDEKYISIVDGSGRTLFDGGSLSEAGVGLTATQMDMQRKLEKGIETEVQTLLDRVAGPNRAVVRVKADMDFSQQEQLSETYAPGGANNQGVTRSSSSVQETFNGEAGSGATAPGTAANLPGVRAAQAGASGPTQYQRTETTTNFEVSKSTQRTVRNAGQIKRLSVSVLLDSSISQQDALGLRDAVAAAAGIDQARNDQLVVTTAAFGNAATPDAVPAAPPAVTDLVSRYAPIGAPLVAALFVLLVVWRMSRSVTPKQPRLKARTLAQQPTLAPAMAAALPTGGAALATAAIDAGGVGGQLPAPEGTLMLAEPTPRRSENPEQTRRRKEIHDRMTNLAQTNPEAVAEIIHSWIAQDDGKRK